VSTHLSTVESRALAVSVDRETKAVQNCTLAYVAILASRK
jgi:hypothetical protein